MSAFRALVALGVVAAAVTVSVTQPTSARASLGLPVAAGVHLSGFPDSRNSHAFSLASAGDVNGDGRPDVIVGAGDANPRKRPDAGAAYVIFGQPALAPVDVGGASGFPGFVVQGAGLHYQPYAHDDPDNDLTGYRVTGIGDVNGDGLADVAISAPFASNSGRGFSGSIYVVFGRTSTTAIDLRALGDAGYRIDGPHPGSTLGISLAPTGDINGDGRPDLIAGTSPGLYQRSGSAYVVFGQPQGGRVIDLANLGEQGYLIDGGSSVKSAGWSVAGLGDMNGDGVPDVAVGAPFEHLQKRKRSGGFGDEGTGGSVFVVYGQRTPATVELQRLGDRGYRIDGAPFTAAGTAIAGVGDMNGDGVRDLLIDAVGGGDTFGVVNGSAYVVFGVPGSGDLNLGRLGERGLRLLGVAGGATGTPLAGLGDVNGDGLSDALIGAPLADVHCRTHAGAAYVVYGRPGSGTVALDRLAPGGYRIDGALPVDNAGAAVAGLPDLNGDGRPDMLIGSPAYQNNPGIPIGGQPPTWSTDVVMSSPRPTSGESSDNRGCIRLRVKHTTLRRLKRTGIIQAVVILREPRRNYNDVEVTQILGRRRSDEPFLGLARLGKAKPGSPIRVTIHLTRSGLQRVRRSHRIRLRVTASQSTAGGDECCPAGPTRSVIVTLGP